MVFEKGTTNYQNIKYHKKLRIHESLFIDISCRKLRLVDIEEFHNRQDALELSTFQTIVMKHMESAKETLLKM